jgi:transcriptional regulator with XRE-family HTH domain/tetratricopeptide (TPR) repeat protein
MSPLEGPIDSPIAMAATLGENIRAIRHRKALTQEALAEKAKLKKLTLRQIENGKSVPRFQTIQKIARALNVTPEELTGPPLSIGEPFGERRIAGFSSSGGRHAASEQEARPFPPDLEVHVSGIRKALLDFNGMVYGRRDVEPANATRSLTEIRQLVDAAYHLRQASQYSKLGTLLPPLLIAAQLAAREYRDEQQRMAMGLLVEANHVAAAFLKKAGRPELAWVAIDRSLITADLTETLLLKAASSYRLANLLLDMGQLDDAAEIASRSVDLLEGGIGTAMPQYLSMWGALLLKRASIASRQGNAATTWECIGEAKAAARRLEKDRNDFWTAFGPTNVAIHEVSLAAELGEWGRAKHRAQSISVAGLPAPLIERRASFLIDVARCFANEKQDKEALRLLLEADQIAPEAIRHSRHARSVLTDLLARERKGFLPELRELAGRAAIQA